MNKEILCAVFFIGLFMLSYNAQAADIYANPSSFNHTFYLYEREENNLTQKTRLEIVLTNNDNLTYHDINFTSNYSKSYSPQGVFLHPDGNGNFTFFFEIEVKDLDDYQNQSFTFDTNITGYYEAINNATNETVNNYITLKSIPINIQVISYLEAESVYYFKKCYTENDKEACEKLNGTSMSEIIMIYCEENPSSQGCTNVTVNKNVTVTEVIEYNLIQMEFLREILGNQADLNKDVMSVLTTVNETSKELVQDQRNFWIEQESRQIRLRNNVNAVRKLLEEDSIGEESKDWFLVNQTKMNMDGRIIVENENVNEIMMALGLSYEEYTDVVREMSSELEYKSTEETKTYEEVKQSVIKFYVTHKATVREIELKRQIQSRDTNIMIIAAFIVIMTGVLYLFLTKTKKGTRV